MVGDAESELWREVTRAADVSNGEVDMFVEDQHYWIKMEPKLLLIAYYVCSISQ